MSQIERSAFSSEFLDTVEQWASEYHDLFIFARYSVMAGAKESFWFDNFSDFKKQLDLFAASTDVCVFRDNQFPLRGIVTNDFIQHALGLLPDGAEGGVVRYIVPPNTPLYVNWVDSHAEILDCLKDMIGDEASVGFYPTWWKNDSENLISALVPLKDGTLKRGVY